MLSVIFSYFHRSYRERVIRNEKQSIYLAQGGFTYFIPVEEGFKVKFAHNVQHAVVVVISLYIL